MKTCFSEEKLIKQFGNPPPPIRREPPLPPPFQLIPYFCATFSYPPLCTNFENKKPHLLL